MRKFILNIVFFLLPLGLVLAQSDGIKKKVLLDGNLLTMWITECGDTLFLANLDETSVSAPRVFASDAERMLYERYRRYAVKVYPYAVEAIKVFREVEYFTKDMKRRERRKRIKELQRDMEKEFEDPLKKLTKLQGYVMMKMIERELEVPTHELVKNLRGGFTAFYWSTLGWLYGHHLKDGYAKGDDPILDIVLEDFDISYSIPPGSRLEDYDSFEKYFSKNKKEDTSKTEKQNEENKPENDKD